MWFSYKDIGALSGRRNTAIHKLVRALLDAFHGYTAHNIGVGVAIGNDSFPLGMLLFCVKDIAIEKKQQHD